MRDLSQLPYSIFSKYPKFSSKNPSSFVCSLQPFLYIPSQPSNPALLFQQPPVTAGRKREQRNEGGGHGVAFWVFKKRRWKSLEISHFHRISSFEIKMENLSPILKSKFIFRPNLKYGHHLNLLLKTSLKFFSLTWVLITLGFLFRYCFLNQTF